MIKIICGVYGGKNGLKRPGDKPFSLPPAEEARLVARKVAAYVNEPASDVYDTENDFSIEDDAAPIGFDEMPPEDFSEDGEDEAEIVEEIIDLETLTIRELREMGEAYGLTFKANTKKADMIAAITAAQSQMEDGEDAPTFDAAEAVL